MLRPQDDSSSAMQKGASHTKAHERPSRSSAESKDMIKQLMKKHFVAPNSLLVPHRHEDAKAAYLKHAEESGLAPSEIKPKPGKVEVPASLSIKDEISPARSSILGGNGTSKL